MRTPEPRRFFVYRGKHGAELELPVGPVGEVLMRVVQSEEEQAREGKVLCRGRLAEFPLATVLDAVSLGRQCVGIDIFIDAVRVGALCLKGGQVLFAIAGKVTGMGAMRALLDCSEGHFLVYRTTLTGQAEPLGSVRDIVRRHREPTEARAHDLLSDEDASELSLTTVRPPRSSPILLSEAANDALNDVTLPRARAVRELPEASVAARARLRTAVGTGTQGLWATPRTTHEASEPGRPWAPEPKVRPSHVRMSVASALRRGPPVVCVTSPKGGTGRTTVAVNLAVALARRNQRVLLIDADANGVLGAVRTEAAPLPGVSEVLRGVLPLEQAMLETRVPNLRILPSGVLETDPLQAMNWSALVDRARAEADVVLVDCPPGVYGETRAVASVASHALMVVSADPASCRAVQAHQHALRTQTSESLALAGIVLNMLDYHARPSLHMFEELCASSAGNLVFEVPIPRSPALMEACARGVPMAAADLPYAPSIAYCFELLAAILLERLGMVVPMAHAEPLL
jgi:MinD-like ATPase involved in chromosome partitioning or flagellar assembly